MVLMLVTIHQPNYLPWPGFFHKWLISDAFIILDTVQYHKNEWQNRNRIKTVNGAQWLTVPVSYHLPQTIREVGIASPNWARKQISAIEQAYARAPYLDACWPRLRETLSKPWEQVAELNVAVIRTLGEMLGCHAPLHLASEMETASTDPTGRLISLCKELGGDAYLSGREGRGYLEAERFSEAGIDLWFQEVEAPRYPQLHGPFISHLSVIDMLFNLGPATPEIILQMGDKKQ
ncbi:MAG: WbqC family protein [Mariprofundaceae bacterium]|nr:WbqC family protein [Mariprofundaceae bacterium]